MTRVVFERIDAPLQERVEELRAWARGRIEECRRQELKFAGQALIEAWQERSTLQAVLRILSGEDTPDGEVHR